jgi:hypothetical protein
VSVLPGASASCLRKKNGTPCNDGNACTKSDKCFNQKCVGASPVKCVALSQCHVAGVCNRQTGKCSNPAKRNGLACSDGDACTASDTCQAGKCVPGKGVKCAALNQCHDAGECNPETGKCSNPTKENGYACNDRNACTRPDTCQAGKCVGIPYVTCEAQDQCHLAGVCDIKSGQCTNPVKPSGVACNDGNACTQSDTCQAGTCVGAAPVICTAQDQCRDAGVCDMTTGLCSNPAAMNGLACNDGNACTASDTCQVTQVLLHLQYLDERDNQIRSRLARVSALAWRSVLPRASATNPACAASLRGSAPRGQ